MFDWTALSRFIPTVERPVHRLSFNEKAKWTLLILVLFYLLGSITVWGVNPDAIAHFEFLEIVFGSRFGSLITLGIGPIVTASIILQLLVGSKIIDWDLRSKEGEKKFTAAQKLLTIAFCFIEAVAYVAAGAIPPLQPFFGIFIVLQLAFGGIIIMLMDEVTSKWGIGSGVSLFIAAGVAKTIFIRIFNPLTQAGELPMYGELPAGIIPGFIASLMEGTPMFFSLLPLIATIIVFIMTLYIQGIRVEIPMAFSLPFGKFAARRWPIRLLYTSNIPVILTAAVLANLQVLGRTLYSSGITFLGVYNEQGRPTSGLMYYLSSPSGDVGLIIITVLGSLFAIGFALMAIRIWRKYAAKLGFVGAIVGMIVGYLLIQYYNLPAVTLENALRSLVYLSVYILGSIVFSIFWVNTAGMDAKSVAEQFKSSYLTIPGFRHDPRIIERVLERYIPALTVLGGAFVGFLAAFADLTSAIGTGTGILLTVMIIYQFYEQIITQHYEDMHPALRRFIR
jgi:preprotein translocase subunit SecY